MKNKKILKKLNSVKKNNIVKVLRCGCGCQGKPFSAAGNGYMGSYL
mgnify:CR=1 FL=1